ncbi:MAG: hypothetical protein U0931_00445 [Vulcanimicrobiota bacterium]
MRGRRSGWTLFEMVVVCALGGLVILISSQVMDSTLKVSSLESQRNFCLCQLQAYVAQIERDVQRSCAAGLAWSPASGNNSALLSIHPQQNGALVGPVTWEQQWICYQWSRQTSQLFRARFPASGVQAPLDHPLSLPLADQQMLVSQPPRGRCIGGSVSKLSFTLDPGALAHLVIEAEIRLPGRATPATLRVDHQSALRNRS